MMNTKFNPKSLPKHYFSDPEYWVNDKEDKNNIFGAKIVGFAKSKKNGRKAIVCEKSGHKFQIEAKGIETLMVTADFKFIKPEKRVLKRYRMKN